MWGGTWGKYGMSDYDHLINKGFDEISAKNLAELQCDTARVGRRERWGRDGGCTCTGRGGMGGVRSEEHTSELQSPAIISYAV